MKLLFTAVLVAFMLSVSGFSMKPVSAQHVPVMGDDGWILPKNDDVSPFDTGSGSAPAPALQAALEPTNTTPVTAQTGSYYNTVAEAAAYYGVSADYLWSVVGCETGYTYRTDLTGRFGEYGPFQFMESTFYWLAELSGHGGSWGSAYDQAWVAAWAFANGYASHWVCA